MLALAFFGWWYGRGWKGSVNNLFNFLKGVNQSFSVSTLFKTLFDPWRRIMSYPGSGINAHVQAAIDNTVSRFVGFCVRLCVLLAALIVNIVVLAIGLLEVVLWPLMPVAVLVLIILGFVK